VYNSQATEPNLHSPNAAMMGGAMQGAGIGMDIYKDYKGN